MPEPSQPTTTTAATATEAAGAPLRPEHTPGRPGVPTDPHAASQGLPGTHDEAATAEADDAAIQILSEQGAQCGDCGDQPGDRICPNCERCRGWYVAALRKAGWAPRSEAAAYRAEVLAEVTTWLVKKAREFHVSSRKREREQGDLCAVLASKIARGAVRPDNLRMLPNPGFFEHGQTYVSGTWKFRCEAISPSPGTGELRALGWKYAPVYGVHHWHAAALDPDDWQHGGWTEDAAAKAVQP